jgi:hypothetical protein
MSLPSGLVPTSTVSRDGTFAEAPKASNDVYGEVLEEQLGNSSSVYIWPKLVRNW